MRTIRSFADLFGPNFVPYEKQEAWIRTPKTQSLFLAGFGAGKSFALAMRCILAVLEGPRSDGIIISVTYEMCLNVNLKALLTLEDAMRSHTGKGIIAHVNKSRMEVITKWGSKILLRSATRCQNLVGLNLGWAALDEVTTMPRQEEVYDLMLSRLRCPNYPAHRRSLFAATTPAGYHGVLRRMAELRKADESKVCMVRASSMDNPHLDRAFVENLRASYSKARWRAEVLGEVMAPSTAVFPEFSARHVVPWLRDDQGEWIGGADWGITRHHFLELDVVELTPGVRTYVVVGEHFTPNESIDRQNKWWHDVKDRRRRHPIAVGIDRADTWKQGKMLRAFGWRTRINEDSKGNAARVLPGLELLRDLLDPADGSNPRLYISEEVARAGRQHKWSILYCLQQYSWMKIGDHVVDVVAKHGQEHCVDSLRYSILAVEKWKTSRGYYQMDQKPRTDHAIS